VLSVGRRGKQVADQSASSDRVSDGRARASLGSAGTAERDGRVRSLFGRAKSRPRTRAIAAVTAVVAVVAGAGVYLLTRGSGTPPNAPITYGAVTLPGPFRVMSVTPAPGSRQADGSLPVRVTFSAPPDARSPMPTVTPDVAGSWQIVGDSTVFTPTMPFRPSTKITLNIPADVRSNAGHVLAGPKTAQYTTGTYSTLRLSEMLGQLGYLPWSWQLPNVGLQTQSEANSGGTSDASSSLAGQLALAYDPPNGIFSMEQGYPASLASMWQPDRWNVVLRGAVMAFQSEHNMSVDGTVTPALWSALFKAVMNGQNNVNGYTYAVADQVDPETLTIYHDGQVVLRSPTNTGIPASPTVNGTFPVYEKFLETYMSGTNPGGSTYHDLVQYVSYFNGGDAVHYFARPGYGYQQSLGCVELPFTQAKQAFPYLTLGSLVTVTG
jgi:L,D-transpeptidase catalytic domain/Bacterial Ig-like domain